MSAEKLSKLSKLSKLAGDFGYDGVPDMLEKRGLDSVVPGICSSKGCDYTSEVEPDQNEGWCENCERGTVRSFMVILGII